MNVEFPPPKKPGIAWPVAALVMLILTGPNGETADDLSIYISESGELSVFFGILMLAWWVFGTLAEIAAKRSKMSVLALMGVNLILALVGELGLIWSLWICGWRSRVFGGELTSIVVAFGTTLWGLVWLKKWVHFRLDLRLDSPNLIRVAPIVMCLVLPLILGTLYAMALGHAMGGH
jgi:hypothetical protein